MTGAQKPLNQMNRLTDMLHFPAAVNAGATINILFTIAITWWVAARFPAWPFVWVMLVLIVNLTPVILMRLLRIHADAPYPTVARMDFFLDQHRFSDWVYLAASANMTFWILAAWTLSLVVREHALHTHPAFFALELLAFLLTFFPVLARPLLQQR